MGKASDRSTAERRDAVLLLLRRENSAEVIARQYEVSTPTLYRWRDEFLAGGEAALGKGGGKSDDRDRELADLRAQLEQRDQVIGELTIANRILKKVTGNSR